MNLTNGGPDSRFPQNHVGFNYTSPRTDSIWTHPINSPSWTPSFPSTSSYVPFPVTTSFMNQMMPSTSSSSSAISLDSFNNKNGWRRKRKTEEPYGSESKQHITEEKMAQHMSKLHISSEAPAHPEKETQEIKERRLFMCDEMKKLQTESIIPASLINRIERPTMAVVLWQPRNQILHLTNRYDELENNNNNNNNNNVSEQDFNRMDDMMDAAME